MRKKYYDDAKENAAFERGVDVVTALILKYGQEGRMPADHQMTGMQKKKQKMREPLEAL